MVYIGGLFCQMSPSVPFPQLKNDSLLLISKEWSWLEGMERAMFYFFSLSLLFFVHNIFPIHPWICCHSIAVLKKKLFKFWPGSHMCHWLAQKQQTNCVFLCGWMDVRKLEKESHIHHLLFLSMGVSVCLLRLAFHPGTSKAQPLNIFVCRFPVLGESGLGKSTLINSLFLTDLYSKDYPGPSQRIKKTVQVCPP